MFSYIENKIERNSKMNKFATFITSPFFLNILFALFVLIIGIRLF